jgi:protoheme IX farnesyltransferase
VALVSYVFIYTPLKQKSSVALIVGAVPGAIPPLMGWTAVRGSLEAPGLLLFLVLFLWQVPHFLSLALVLKEDYAAAGLITTPIARGDEASRFELVRYVFATVAVSLLPFPLRIAGGVYLVSAAVLGVVFLILGLTGLRGGAGSRWSRAFFAASIVYLSLLFAALMIDRSAA